jgi:hypothetical protein
MIPPITRRSSTRGLPRVSRGNCGLSRANRAFVSQKYPGSKHILCESVTGFEAYRRANRQIELGFMGSRRDADAQAAKDALQPGELYPRAGFIVTKMTRPAERVVAFCRSGGRVGCPPGECRSVFARFGYSAGSTSGFRVSSGRLRHESRATDRDTRASPRIGSVTLAVIKVLPAPTFGFGGISWTTKRLPNSGKACAAR